MPRKVEPISRSDADAPWLTIAVLVAVCVVILGLGVANPRGPAVIRTDSLGPESGEARGDYQRRAASTVDSIGTGSRWALVSFASSLVPSAAAEALIGARISTVLVRVPDASGWVGSVDTATEGTNEAAQRSTLERALAELGARPTVPSGPEGAVIAAQLRQACACIEGVIVRADLRWLRAVAVIPAVFAVEALPGDAVFGRFAVRRGSFFAGE